MAPKKKGNKKGNDDWESELGETPDPIATASQEAKDDDAANDQGDSSSGGGGLLAALKKNRNQKKKKGKIADDDFLEGEDPTGEDNANGHAEPGEAIDLAAKGPTEATTDDLFDEPVSKGKGGKGKHAKKDDIPKDDDGEAEEEGGIKSKKEKEKEKREREKQRKKEQVSFMRSCIMMIVLCYI